MKELTKLLFLFIMVIGAVTISCTKEGPQGEPGVDGINGVDGDDGANGLDGTAGCITCHKDDQEIPVKVNEYMHSAHYEAAAHTGHFQNPSCSMCHTGTGFLQAVEDGTNSGGSHANYIGMNCYTCHQIHKSYTREDYDMNYTGAVDFILNETAVFNDVTVDAGEPSNTCVKCHQPRHQGANQPDPTKPDTELLTGLSSRFGPHHGAQGALYGGVGAYTTAAQGPGSKGKHNCVFCHVGTDATVKNNGSGGGYETFMAGGHAFNLTYEHDGSLEIARCNECHAGAGASIDIPGIIATNDLLIEGLKDALIDAGILNADGGFITGSSVSYTHKQMAALWNYKTLEEDLSHGLHNPDYTRKLVASSLEYLGVTPN